MNDATPILDVVCAIIRRAGCPATCLVTRRALTDPNLPGKWEFPGGKVEVGEVPEQALLREIREELGIVVEIQGRMTPVTHSYPARSIRLIPYLCQLNRGEPKPLEHDELRWLLPEALDEMDWAEADLPIVAEWKRRIESTNTCSDDPGC